MNADRTLRRCAADIMISELVISNRAELIVLADIQAEIQAGVQNGILKPGGSAPSGIMPFIFSLRAASSF